MEDEHIGNAPRGHDHTAEPSCALAAQPTRAKPADGRDATANVQLGQAERAVTSGLQPTGPFHCPRSTQRLADGVAPNSWQRLSERDPARDVRDFGRCGGLLPSLTVPWGRSVARLCLSATIPTTHVLTAHSPGAVTAVVTAEYRQAVAGAAYPPVVNTIHLPSHPTRVASASHITNAHRLRKGTTAPWT